MESNRGFFRPENENSIYSRLKEHFHSRKTDGLDASVEIPVSRYHCSKRFEKEISLLEQLPLLSLEQFHLKNPGDCRATELLGHHLIEWMTDEGIKVFSNRCRHRGAKILDKNSCATKNVSCPYHGWTYGDRGNLIDATHDPKINQSKNNLSLRSYKSTVQGELNWIQLMEDSQIGRQVLSDWETVSRELTLDGSFCVDQFEFECRANWKLGVESFMETYHFQHTHAETLGSLNHHNCNLVDYYGDHARIVVPLNPFFEKEKQAIAHGSLLSELNVQYYVFPNSFFLLYDGHFARITVLPVSVNQSRWIYQACVPQGASEKTIEAAQMSAQLLRKVEQEDIEILEGIQSGLEKADRENFHLSYHEPVLAHFYQRFENYYRQ